MNRRVSPFEVEGSVMTAKNWPTIDMVADVVIDRLFHGSACVSIWS
jgi:hypothetical protein